MRDRLRLDVAVSEGQEIYSWHGENQFSSSTISSVVKTGPISSGGFIGYLHNIFLDNGIEFDYKGQSNKNGVSVYSFEYAVPLRVSRYHVQTTSGASIVPFHGSFSANASDFELNSLDVAVDRLPNGSNMCSVDTEVKYQLARISGQNALIPESFVLHIDDASHIYTISRSEYSECREFRGESTLRFDVSDNETQPSPAHSLKPASLPPGMILRVGLDAPINEKTAYTGDSVQGVLLESVKVPGTQTVIPKGALLKGIITRLEDRFDPENHYFVKIEFMHLTFANNVFLLHALHKPSPKDASKLYFLYGDPLPDSVSEQLRDGAIIFDSRHLRLDHRFSGEWETTKIAD